MLFKRTLIATCFLGALSVFITSQVLAEKEKKEALKEEVKEETPSVPAAIPDEVKAASEPAADLSAAAVEKAVEEKIAEETVEEDAEDVKDPLMKRPPAVKISKWGNELRIEVEPDPRLPKKVLADIQTVKLESAKGEFLGLKTFTPEEVKRRAEFMINPEVLKLEDVKIKVSTSAYGEWEKVFPLGIGKPPAAPEKTSKKKEKKSEKDQPKKKGWF